MPRFTLPALALTSLALAGPALSDTVTDSLTAALAAYQAGDLRATSAQLGAASTAITAKKSALLQDALPPAPDGMTQEVNTDYAAGLAMMGGGSGVEASYSDAEGNRVTVAFTTESPMLAMMMGMFGSPQAMAMMGKTVDVNGLVMLDQDNSLTAVVDGRILVVINGDQTEKMLPLASMIDWAALSAFDGQK